MILQQADYLFIPLMDGSHALAQVAEVDRCPPGTALLVLSTRREEPGAEVLPLALSEVAALALVGTDLADSGAWTVGGFDQLPRLSEDADLAGLLAEPGALTARDPAVAEAFLNAWHGLYPWDGFGPLFEDMRRPGTLRPGTSTR